MKKLTKIEKEQVWEATYLAMNSDSKMVKGKETEIVKTQGLQQVNQEQQIKEELKIDNNKSKEYKNELQKMGIQTAQTQNHQLKKKLDNQKYLIEHTKQQITESSIQTDMLPLEIKYNQQQIQQSFGDKKLLIHINGEGFQGFRLRSIYLIIKCIMCNNFLPSLPQKQQQQNTYKYQSDCKKCSKQMSVVFQKFIQQQPQNLTQWLIGSIQNYENIEWQLQKIETQTICKCQSMSSPLPCIEFTLEKTKQVASQIKRQKFLSIDQTRQFCHGCATELKFQPEFFVIQ